jgi:hypothetical protein
VLGREEPAPKREPVRRRDPPPPVRSDRDPVEKRPPPPQP